MQVGISMPRFLIGLLALAALALLSERQWRGQVRTVPACGQLELQRHARIVK